MISHTREHWHKFFKYAKRKISPVTLIAECICTYYKILNSQHIWTFTPNLLKHGTERKLNRKQSIQMNHSKILIQKTLTHKNFFYFRYNLRRSSRFHRKKASNVYRQPKHYVNLWTLIHDRTSRCSSLNPEKMKENKTEL